MPQCQPPCDQPQGAPPPSPVCSLTRSFRSTFPPPVPQASTADTLVHVCEVATLHAEDQPLCEWSGIKQLAGGGIRWVLSRALAAGGCWRVMRCVAWLGTKRGLGRQGHRPPLKPYTSLPGSPTD